MASTLLCVPLQEATGTPEGPRQALLDPSILERQTYLPKNLPHTGESGERRLFLIQTHACKGVVSGIGEGAEATP